MLLAKDTDPTFKGVSESLGHREIFQQTEGHHTKEAPDFQDTSW